MKLATRILSLLVLAGLASFYIACDGGGGDNKTEEEKQLIKLSGSWKLNSANDGSDRTSDFPNLALTITGTYVQNGTYNYSFTGTRPNPSPIPVSGTWKFDTSEPNKYIIRDPGTTSEVKTEYTVSDSGLILKFNVPDGSTGWAGGTSRAKSVKGDWILDFTKQ